LRSRLGLACLGLVAACQQLDANASRGSLEGKGPAAPAGIGDPGGQPSDPASTDGCDGVRARALAIRQADCAVCHESPAKEGNFYFVLDDDLLAQAVSSTGQRFIVPGAPADSRLFRRVAAGEMPPRRLNPRPTAEDVAVLRQWIASCMSTSDAGSSDGSSASPDAAAAPDPGDGCGQPGQSCCGANTCAGGACCVLGACLASGQACGGGTGIGGMPEGLPGVCIDGTCRDGGGSCGGVAQPCCGESGSCTAPHTGCAVGAVCQACGEAGQPCCQNGGAATCVAGLGCSFTGFGRPSMCEPCGADGQPCCGNGLAAQKTCGTGLTCRFVAGMGDHCGM
jgi:hypothetical protein